MAREYSMERKEGENSCHITAARYICPSTLSNQYKKVEMITQETNPVIISLCFTLEPIYDEYQTQYILNR